MKKIILGLFLSLLLVVFKYQPALALTEVSPSPEATVTATPIATLINYLLPYPGILPDQFLYPLKMLRDRIMDILIKDPVKKTEFLVLMADKRLGAGKVLIEGNKADLGQTTLYKAEGYLNRAVSEASLAIKSGKNVNGTLDQLRNSSQKHIEVLTALLVKVPDSVKPAIKDILNKTQKDYQKAVEIRK